MLRARPRQQGSRPRLRQYVASETEAKTEAVYLKTEAQGYWLILLTVLSFRNH